MAVDQPWSVRAALAVVNGVDRVVGIVLGGFQAFDKSGPDAPKVPPLAVFRRVTAVGAKGAKWSFIAVIGLAMCAMFAAMIFLPRLKPAPAPAASPIAVSADRAAIARNCREGRYRAFPEIEKTECAARQVSPPAQHQGDAK